MKPADADLARRDSAIPGLVTVLDPAAFVTALRRVAPVAGLGAAHIDYLRWKPHAYARATYRLDVAGAEVGLDVRACRPDDLASWLEDGEPALVPGPLGPGRIVLEQCAVLVTVFPNDLKLPELRHLTDPREREPVLRELLPDRPDLWQGELRCLRYRPERRYVAELRGVDGARAIVKAYTPRAYKRGKRNATAFRPRGPLRLARLLGYSDSRCLLAFEWLPGSGLFDFETTPEIEREMVSAAGAALAALHDESPNGLECWTREDEAAAVASLAAEVGGICPQLAGRAGVLARRLAARFAEAPDLHLPMHGDFTAGQVLVAPPQVALVDLDWACCGDPADDLGNIFSQVERLALDGVRSPDWVEAVEDAMLTGYAQATTRPIPERIGLYTARGLFRRARSPFRTRAPDWPQRTEAVLERVEAVLDARKAPPSM